MDELETLTPDEERLLEMALGSLEEPELPDGFAERFSQRLRAENGAVPAAKVTVLEARGPGAGRWWTPVLLAAAAIVLFFGFLRTSQTQSEPIGVVAASEGNLKVDDASVLEAVALKAGMEISTEAESASVLVLAEASEQVRLDSETVVTVNSLRQPQKDSKRVVGEFGLKKGRIWITESASKVAVRTPHALLMPVGTEYEAISGEDSTEVVVWEGEVIARSPDGSQSIRVQQGEELVLDGETWKRKAQQARPIQENRLEDNWHNWNRRVQIAARPDRRERLARAQMREELRQLPGVQNIIRRRRQLRQQQNGTGQPRVGDYPRAVDRPAQRPAQRRQQMQQMQQMRRQGQAQGRPAPGDARGRNPAPERRRRIRENLQNMTPEQRQELRRRAQNMTPEQRQAIRRNLRNRTQDAGGAQRDFPRARNRERLMERRRQRRQAPSSMQSPPQSQSLGTDSGAPAWRNPSSWRSNPLDSNSRGSGVQRWRARPGARTRRGGR